MFRDYSHVLIFAAKIQYVTNMVTSNTTALHQLNFSTKKLGDFTRL